MIALKDWIWAFLGTERFGMLDALLVVLVVFPVYMRTPVGDLGNRALGMVWDGAPEPVSLTSYFHTGPPDEVADWALGELPDLDDPMFIAEAGQMPRLYRVAAVKVFAKKTPKETVARMAVYADVPKGERLLAVLDDLYLQSDGNAEKALEIAVVGEEARDRAIARATAAGFDDPALLEVHRPFLSASAGREADRFVSGTIALGTVLDLQFPVSGKYRISSKYGPRHHPVYKKPMMHNGIDIAVPIGTEVVSVQDGVVHSIHYDDRSGKYVSVKHANGVRTTYCHLNKQLVAKGDVVKKGDLIAMSGNTGRSTGPHVHYIVRINNKTVDPLKIHRLEKKPGS